MVARGRDAAAAAAAAAARASARCGAAAPAAPPSTSGGRRASGSRSLRCSGQARETCGPRSCYGRS
eukprot:11214987-Alexandrium_andersonii.AAC.1